MKKLHPIEKKYREIFHQSHTLGWGSITSQYRRFKIIKEIGIRNHDKILDVGCGKGDLYSYLSHDLPNIDYWGIDVREPLLEDAEEMFPKGIFICSDILNFHPHPDAPRRNWVVGSGIFCLHDGNWKSKTTKIIENMFNLCENGVAINFLSVLSPKPNPKMKYCSVREVIDIVKKFTKSFTIRHDYAENDFTVYMHK